ncbi:putative eukaryotic initiation factor-3, subunit 5 [Cardiosporidium cionae]|uniref:Eukaryotic initiation factor-3, subunit 5 n=1 Tax=Cardiosporidium cionae TaxID=476202 RepID=A0ABQ7JG62_9APIC|nr:putative eukaryotic initiation factor-3, subunit 5 [Cardiosporidium cionae]|eukprot:KAF8822956.1 putative eukaryotic initiation factor-3, subunit 5 [Cardiosporidium cionae]
MSVLRSLNRLTGQSDVKVPKCFDVLPFSTIKCRLQPVVVFTILDAYVRREDKQNHVIGTLLGTVIDSNTVDITDCFVDRHSLTDMGLLQIIKDQHELMFELKQKVNPKEQVVGWFCTGSEMSELTCAVHGWFKSSNISKFQAQAPLTEPIHLLVDSTLKSNTLSVKAFMQVPMQIVKESLFQFQEIPLEMYTSPTDRIGVSMLLKAREVAKQSRGDEVIPLKDGFYVALTRLAYLLRKCSEYVTGVLNETEKPDTDIGRLLSKALAIDFVADADQFEEMCQNTLQDNLMVSHLSNLARLEFSLAERLNTSFL